MTPVNAQVRDQLERWIRRQRDQHGEVVAKTMLRAYLDGANAALKIVGESTVVLRDALEGN